MQKNQSFYDRSVFLTYVITFSQRCVFVTWVLLEDLPQITEILAALKIHDMKTRTLERFDTCIIPL